MSKKAYQLIFGQQLTRAKTLVLLLLLLLHQLLSNSKVLDFSEDRQMYTVQYPPDLEERQKFFSKRLNAVEQVRPVGCEISLESQLSKIWQPSEQEDLYF